MKKFTEINLKHKPETREKILDLSKSYEYNCILDSNFYPDPYGSYAFMAAIGAYRLLKADQDSFEALKKEHQKHSSWLFGHFAYDLKNQLEALESRHPKRFNFAALSFFEPKILFLQSRNRDCMEIWVQEEEEKTIKDWLNAELPNKPQPPKTVLPKLQARQSKEEYLEAIQQLKKEILYGNIYEINYCTEFFSKGAKIEPLEVFKKLNTVSPMPFACFYQHEENYLMSASPERYLLKKANRVYSQPIKGTAKRGQTEQEDTQIKKELQSDLKEQTENVMIVDLVRNDLSRTATKASVQVEELFGVYTFPQVHQLISTVSSKLSEQHHFTDLFNTSFPMGSMTGAPKISAMEIADQQEASRRELYSGSVGYISPEGDFDFNVIIRSLLYSAKNNYLSLTVGGAITDLSDPEKEYEECLLKAKAIFDLNKSI